MSARAKFARALAALAVTGVAIAGPASGAGASTSPEPTPIVSLAPGGATVDLGSDTVVTVGGPTAPHPAASVTSAVDGQATAHVGGPTTRPAPLTTPTAPVPTPAPDAASRGIRLVEADIAARVCLVATLFGGDAGSCFAPSPSPTTTTTALADAMANAVVCARVAVLGSDAVSSCDSGNPSGSLTAAPSALGLVLDAQACVTATVLGAADGSRCSSTGDAGTPPSEPNGVATVAGTGHACLGIAVPASVDPAGCAADATTGGGHDQNEPADDGNGAVTAADACLGLAASSTTAPKACSFHTLSTPATSVGGVEPAGTPTLVADANLTAPHGSDDGSDLAFTGADTLLPTFVGLGAIATGVALRRLGRLGTVR